MPLNKPAVVLLSGGLDSTTALAIARADGYRCYALSFDYGQRHDVELDAARRGRRRCRRRAPRRREDRPSRVRRVGPDAAVDVPKGRSVEEMGDGIPITYVPARNTIFLSFALAWAETLGGLATSSSASTRSTTAATRTAAPSTSPPSRRWRTWRRRPASRDGCARGSTPR